MAEVKVTKELAKPYIPAPVTFKDFFTPVVPFGKFFGLSPFALMRDFTDEMDRLFKAVPTTGADLFVPALDVTLVEGNLIVKTDLPGLKKEEVKIEVTDTTLTIEGERKSEVKEEKAGLRRFERSYGKFYREIPLPEGAKIDLTKAELIDGVLTVTLPVPEAKKARPVPIEEGGKAKIKAA